MAIERELKYQLDEAGYDRLKTSLGMPSASKEQVNLYLDTPGRELCGADAALRLRREGERLLLTYKRGMARRGSFFEIRELETEVTQDLWNRLAGGELPDTALEPLDRLRHDFPHAGSVISLGTARNLRL